MGFSVVSVLDTDCWAMKCFLGLSSRLEGQETWREYVPWIAESFPTTALDFFFFFGPDGGKEFVLRVPQSGRSLESFGSARPLSITGQVRWDLGVVKRIKHISRQEL